MRDSFLIDICIGAHGMCNFIRCLRMDVQRNSSSIKSLFIVVFFRLSSWFALSNFFVIRIIGIPIRLFYKIIVEFLLGVELPDRVIVGPGIAIFHGVGLVVNQGAIIGMNVTLRQSTTIGALDIASGAPRIADNVDVGANAVILGDIQIGEGSRIGAGAIVVDSCPPGSILVSPKAVIKNSIATGLVNK